MILYKCVSSDNTSWCFVTAKRGAQQLCGFNYASHSWFKINFHCTSELTHCGFTSFSAALLLWPNRCQPRPHSRTDFVCHIRWAACSDSVVALGAANRYQTVPWGHVSSLCSKLQPCVVWRDNGRRDVVILISPSLDCSRDGDGTCVTLTMSSHCWQATPSVWHICSRWP